MGAQDQNAKSSSDYHILWLIAFVFLVSLGLWLAFAPQLKAFFLITRVYELEAIYFVIKWFVPNTEVERVLELARQLGPLEITLEQAQFLSEFTGSYLRYVVAPILVVIGAGFYLINIKVRLKRKHSMRTLLASEARLWPPVLPVVKLDLVKDDIDQGPWAMSMTPIQFCKNYKLVNIEIAPSGAFSQEPNFKVTLIRERAERALAAQLGRPWQDAKAMPPHRRALFASFIARGCRDSKAGQELLAQLSKSAAKGKLDYSGVDALWKKHIKNKDVDSLCQRHGYELTLLASALEFARQDGVVAAAEFLWLKPIDRRLWYMLNSIGRQTPHVEAAGAFSHWKTEKVLHRPLSIPMVDEAVTALELALSEMIYTPDEKEREKLLNPPQAQGAK